MKILDKAIKVEGSVQKLANALGIKANAISNWRHPTRGVPHAWKSFLTLKYGTKKQKKSPV